MDPTAALGAQVQTQVQRLVLDQLRSQGAGVQRLIASAAPVAPSSAEPNLGRYLDVRV